MPYSAQRVITIRCSGDRMKRTDRVDKKVDGYLGFSFVSGSDFGFFRR